MWQEPTTAKAMTSRSGAGKARHIDTRYYSVQDVVKRGVVTLRKVATEDNPADILTKSKGVQDIRPLAATVGVILPESAESWGV